MSVIIVFEVRAVGRMVDDLIFRHDSRLLFFLSNHVGYKEYRRNEMTDNREDKVNHPTHYISPSGLEVIDVIEAFTSDLAGMDAVCTANAIKYILRWKHKNGVEDLKKARWYIDRLISLRTPFDEEEEEDDKYEDVTTISDGYGRTWKFKNPSRAYSVADQLLSLMKEKDGYNEAFGPLHSQTHDVPTTVSGNTEVK